MALEASAEVGAGVDTGEDPDGDINVEFSMKIELDDSLIPTHTITAVGHGIKYCSWCWCGCW